MTAKQSITCGSRSFNITVKKFPGPQHLVNPLAVIAAAGQLMGTSVVPYILYRPVQHFQATVKHFTLHEAGPAIIIAVKDDIRGGDVFNVGDG